MSFSRAALGVVVLAFACSWPVRAAEPPAEFAVTDRQLQSLGVQLHVLTPQAGLPSAAFMARVVAPPHREQVAGAPLAGVVEQLLVAPQQAVNAGQPLLRLASPAYGELQLAVVEATQRAALSARAVEREQALYAEGVIPERRWLEARSVAEGDRARLLQARAALRLAAGHDGVSLRPDGAAALRESLLVRAREAGTVIDLPVRPGQRVQAGDVLVRLVDPRELWLDIAVPADLRSADLSPGTQVEPAVAAEPGSASWRAQLLSSGPVVGDNQTVTVRARVTQGARVLRPGDVLSVRLAATATPAGSWTVPAEAVVRQDARTVVFVRTPQGFAVRPVTVTGRAGGAVQVRGALREGEAVAASAVIALKAAWLGKGGAN